MKGVKSELMMAKKLQFSDAYTIYGIEGTNGQL